MYNSEFLNYYFLNYPLILNILIINIFFFILLLSIFVISLRNTIHTIFFFMFICLLITELCILLQMEFLALTFVIIYLGAICVLILFQVKLVKLLTEKNQKIFINNTLFVPCLIIFIIVPIIQCGTIFFIYSTSHSIFDLTELVINNSYLIDSIFYKNWNSSLIEIDTLILLGVFIYYYNPIYLLIGSLILIIAMIGAIILTLEKKNISNNV
jgi:NADH:ubiquinone oxidoreductase subunit 6 (subunit J)